MQSKKSVGISFDIDILEQIDKKRGEIPRSRYIWKFLEKAFSSEKSTEKENKLDLLDVGLSPLDQANPDKHRRYIYDL